MNAVFPTDDQTVIFVYGTLMRGECRHGPLREQTFVANAATEPCYRLHLIDDYPGLVDATAANGVSVVGELWSVDNATLKRLDDIECVDSGLFERRIVQLHGAIPTAHAWFYMLDVSSMPDIGSDWRLRPQD